MVATIKVPTLVNLKLLAGFTRTQFQL